MTGRFRSRARFGLRRRWQPFSDQELSVIYLALGVDDDLLPLRAELLREAAHRRIAIP